MRRSGILNGALNEAIDRMGHGDIMIIADAGLPVPEHAARVDLAITRDYPDILTILALVAREFIYEKFIVAEEQKMYNPVMFESVSNILYRCPVETVPHMEIMEDWRNKARVIVRTGAYMPWGNVVLVSGIDAPAWFKKEGVIIPDYYQERASRKED